MPPKPQRDYWDTSVFLALFQRGDGPKRLEQREHAIRLLEDARQGKTIIVTSALTLAEARRGDGVPPLPGEEYATLKAFFKHSYIEVVPVDRAIGELAAEYGERFGLNPGDAVQLATAVRSKASRLLAWDGDFHRPEAMRGAPMPIEYPWRPPDPDLPLLEVIKAAKAADAQAVHDETDEVDVDTTEALVENMGELPDDSLNDEFAEEDLSESQPAVGAIREASRPDGDTSNAEEAEKAAEGTATVEHAAEDGSAVRGSAKEAAGDTASTET